MYCIGLTGQIGSGKSTVANFFSKHNIKTISADKIAKNLTKKGQPSYFAINEHFGDTCLLDSGELNRPYLLDLITHNPEARLWLEQLLHPLIRQQIIYEIQLAESLYCVIEIPLLKNKQAYPYLDRVLLVSSDYDQQLLRIQKRHACSQEEAKAMMDMQSQFTYKLDAIDDQIINNGSLTYLATQVDTLHEKYIRFIA